MTTYEEVMKTLDEMDAYAIQTFKEFVDNKIQNLLWLDEVEKDVENYKKTGILNFEILTDYFPDPNKKASKQSSIQSNSSSKENDTSVFAKSSQGHRQLRSALKDSTQLANVQVNSNVADNLVIKAERLTCDRLEENVKSADQNSPNLQKGKIEMPPPKPLRALKKQKEATSQLETVRIKTERLTKKLRKGLNLDDVEESIVRESDVQLQEVKADVVVIDSDEEMPRRTRARTKTRPKQTEEVVESTRSTRTKTKAKKNVEIEIENTKRLRDSSSEDQATLSKLSDPKSVKIRKLNAVPQDFKDMNVVNSNINNLTIVLEGKRSKVFPEIACNITRVLETADRDAEEQLKDIMTDDEDIINTSLQALKCKQIFSPCAKSSMKKKVEGFEKSDAPSHSALDTNTGRITRAQQQATPTHKQINKFAASKGIFGSIERPNIKNLTPSTLKSRSALKSSQAEFRERELRRQQNEIEINAKKEALLQAQKEEKRRKREERQLKAQQAREALKKSKKSALESAERVKQEKIKQLSAVKEDKLVKKCEPSTQKQALACKTPLEVKQNDVNKVKTPLYLKYKMPLLPTVDCYDSDDSRSSTPVPPYWQLQIKTTAKIIEYCEQFKRKMVSTKPQTVDLRKIFPTIAPAKLKRTSSAIWNRSNISKLAEVEDEDF